MTVKESEEKKPLSSDLLEIKEAYESWKRLHWCRSKMQSAFQLASLMAFFSLIATVEFPVPVDGRKIDSRLVIAVVSASSGLVAVSVLVKVISMYILPHLDMMAEMSVSDAISAPHDQIINWIFCACILGHTVAPVLFCLDLILISWIKFPRVSEEAPYAVTAILTPMIGVILIFGNILYQQMSQFKKVDIPFPSRRYSEIAGHWENDSSLSQVSVISSTDENFSLMQSHYFLTSYGAVRQSEHLGTPNSVYADIWC